MQKSLQVSLTVHRVAIVVVFCTQGSRQAQSSSGMLGNQEGTERLRTEQAPSQQQQPLC